MTETNGETLISKGGLSPERLRPCDLWVLNLSRVLRRDIIVVVMISCVSGVVKHDAIFVVEPRSKLCWRPAVVSLMERLVTVPGALPP